MPYNQLTMERVEVKTDQVHLRVTPRIKEKARREADLASAYGWIPAATVSDLFTWVVDKHLPEVIKQHIMERRKGAPRRDNVHM